MAQEFAGELDIYKLAGGGDGGGVAAQRHFINAGGERRVR